MTKKKDDQLEALIDIANEAAEALVEAHDALCSAKGHLSNQLKHLALRAKKLGSSETVAKLEDWRDKDPEDWEWGEMEMQEVAAELEEELEALMEEED